MPDLAPDAALDPVIAPTPPARWSPLTRLGFRFAFCYFMLYALGCGNATIWEIIPFHIGEHLEEWTNWPFLHAAQYLAQHMFHVQGVGAKIHGGGSGDKAIDWISCGVMLAIALVATLLWTALDRSRLQHPRLFGWMRFILRLTLGTAMLGYGLAKVFPLQMSLPSLGVLNENLGNSAPMTMLWSLIGLNPLYEIVCGATEVISGALILFRRTALIGSLLTAFVVSNVVLYNFFFDVPVKIYATHLLLMSWVVIAPDVRSLWNYFILHRPAVPTGNGMSPSNRRDRRIETICVTVVLLLIVGVGASEMWPAVRKQRAALRHPSPLTGIWTIDSATLNGQPKPLLSAESQPITQVIFEPNGLTRLRDASRQLWRAGAPIDDKKHTLTLYSIDIANTYAMNQPDTNHLILTPVPDKDAKDKTIKEGTLALTRIPTPTHYPLEDRGFHLINEWGLER